MSSGCGYTDYMHILHNYDQKYGLAEIHDNVKIEFCKNTNMKSWCIRRYRFQSNNTRSRMSGYDIYKNLRKINNDDILCNFTYSL